MLRPGRGTLVPRALLPPEPVPQLHGGQRGEAPVLPEEVLSRRTLLHRLLLRPDVSGGKPMERYLNMQFTSIEYYILAYFTVFYYMAFTNICLAEVESTHALLTKINKYK